MKKGAYKELKRNTLIIAISTIGSKAISFILAPLYSYFLTTSEYGTMDLITTTVGLLVPLLCLDIYDAAFRFASDDTYTKDKVLTNTVLICIIETILIVVFYIIARLVYPIPDMVFICLIIAIADSFYSTISQFARGGGKIHSFALSGVVNSVILLASNIVFMILLSLGLYGWAISFTIAKTISVAYLCLDLKIWKIFHLSLIDKEFYKDAFKFCIPLIPSATMWWIMNVSDRYVISFFLGTAATGIYAVANKLPSILSVLENVFYQAWQTSAINTMSDKNRDEFYSNVFFEYFRFMCIGCIGLLIILKPFITILFAEEYFSAWQCAAILVLGVMLHALTGNLGTLYTVFKDTKGALKTSSIGAIVNTGLNILFVPKFGIIAAACTTVVGYLVVLFVRWNDSKKYVHLTLQTNNVFIYLLLLCVQFILYYVPGSISYFIRIVICLGVLFVNKDYILKLILK